MTEDTIKKKLYTFKHKCSLCDYETNKKQDLKKHQLVHANKVWQCAHCNYKTARESNLKSHTKSIHENVRYHCKLCPYTTTRTGYLNEHVKFIHKNKTTVIKILYSLQSWKPNYA
jgi:ribosomal protein L37AE/L43A